MFPLTSFLSVSCFRHIFGALGVLLLAVGYAVVGGFMFSAIETRAALNYKEKHIEMPPAQLLR